MADYKLKNVCDFDLAQTLECGQCFHFVKLDEEDYVLTAKGYVLHVSRPSMSQFPASACTIRRRTS